MNDIVIALIGAGSSLAVGILSLLGVVISNRNAKRDMMQQIEVAQAVTDNKIEELTREVREHNGFAKRMPVVETEIKHCNEEINHLRKFHETR